MAKNESRFRRLWRAKKMLTMSGRSLADVRVILAEGGDDQTHKNLFAEVDKAWQAWCCAASCMDAAIDLFPEARERDAQSL